MHNYLITIYLPTLFCVDTAQHLGRLESSMQLCYTGEHDSTVVKVLCYKSEGRWFDTSWCHWNFFLT